MRPVGKTLILAGLFLATAQVAQARRITLYYPPPSGVDRGGYAVPPGAAPLGMYPGPEGSMIDPRLPDSPLNPRRLGYTDDPAEARWPSYPPPATSGFGGEPR